MVGLSSTFNFAIRKRPCDSAASSSMTGAIIRHGPHQPAQQSTRVGVADDRTTESKLASVTLTGLLEPGEGAGRVAPHFPQTGWEAWARFGSTRFFVPQAGHMTTGMSGSFR